MKLLKTYKLNKIELPADVNQWEDDQQLVFLNLYIDNNETLKKI